MRYAFLLLLVTCTVDAAPGEPIECAYYACRGCARAPEYDFACSSHELLRAAFICEDVEPDLCKLNAYGTECCFPNPEEP